MVDWRRGLLAAQRRQAQLVARFAGNGGDLTPGDVRAAVAEVVEAAEAVAECVRQIDEAGVQVKDLDEGLLDFPAKRDDADVLLCWKVGEPAVAFWHGIDEGVAGRKPM